MGLLPVHAFAQQTEVLVDEMTAAAFAAVVVPGRKKKEEQHTPLAADLEGVVVVLMVACRRHIAAAVGVAVASCDASLVDY